MVVKFIATIALCFNATKALAKELYILEPRDIYIETYKYTSMRDPYLYPIDKELEYGMSFNTNLTIARYGGFQLYWKNNLHFDQSSYSGHIKHAGWQYELGLPLFFKKKVPKIELFKQHHSRHLLEETRTTLFPVYDRYGLRFSMYP